MPYPFDKKLPDVGSETGIELEDNYRNDNHEKTKDDIRREHEYLVEVLQRLWVMMGETVCDSQSALLDEILTNINIEHNVKYEGDVTTAPNSPQDIGDQIKDFVVGINNLRK